MKIKVDQLPKKFYECLFGNINAFGKTMCKCSNTLCKCVLIDSKGEERFNPLFCPFLDSTTNLI